MAKSRKTKTRAGKKSRKKPVARAKAPSKKATTKTKAKAVSKTARVRSAPPAAVTRAAMAPAEADPKNTAVNNCVNSVLDHVRGVGRWDDNGHMDSDYNYNKHSMLAFLTDVQAGLQPKYDLNIDDAAFIKACVSAQVWKLKELVYDQAKP
jgi:hypothetical protein